MTTTLKDAFPGTQAYFRGIPIHMHVWADAKDVDGKPYPADKLAEIVIAVLRLQVASAFCTNRVLYHSFVLQCAYRAMRARLHAKRRKEDSVSQPPSPLSPSRLSLSPGLVADRNSSSPDSVPLVHDESAPVSEQSVAAVVEAMSATDNRSNSSVVISVSAQGTQFELSSIATRVPSVSRDSEEVTGNSRTHPLGSCLNIATEGEVEAGTDALPAESSSDLHRIQDNENHVANNGSNGTNIAGDTEAKGCPPTTLDQNTDSEIAPEK